MDYGSGGLMIIVPAQDALVLATRLIGNHGCELIREGGNHSWWLNPLKNKRSAIPRHSEVQDLLVRKICKDLDITIETVSQSFRIRFAIFACSGVIDTLTRGSARSLSIRVRNRSRSVGAESKIGSVLS